MTSLFAISQQIGFLGFRMQNQKLERIPIVSKFCKWISRFVGHHQLLVDFDEIREC